MVKETYYIAKETYYIARGRRDLNESGIAFQVTNPMPIHQEKGPYVDMC